MVEQIIKDLVAGKPGRLVEVNVEEALVIPYDELIVSNSVDGLSGLVDMPAGWSADYEAGMGDDFLAPGVRLFQYIPSA